MTETQKRARKVTRKAGPPAETTEAASNEAASPVFQAPSEQASAANNNASNEANSSSSNDDEGNGRLILFTGGNYRNHMPGDGARYREEGIFRVYDGADNGYELLISLEGVPAGSDAQKERRCVLTLNDDGTITVDGVVYRRDEYSTFGNG